jgi:hypothetical protein
MSSIFYYDSVGRTQSRRLRSSDWNPGSRQTSVVRDVAADLDRLALKHIIALVFMCSIA